MLDCLFIEANKKLDAEMELKEEACGRDFKVTMVSDHMLCSFHRG